MPGEAVGSRLRCPVRGCGLALSALDDGLRCAANHSFDRARSGYFNLLQPQDRRSLAAGDSREAALARRRLYDIGALTPLVEAIAAVEEWERLPAIPAVLDVGCGEGSLLAALAARRTLAPSGVDLSREAIELAARLLPAATWVVANADRALPWQDGAFDLALSITARLPGAELARVLAPGGFLLVAVPGPDDLAELRAALQGGAEERDRLARTAADFAPWFHLERRESVRWHLDLTAEDLTALLASSYRGARRREQERAAELDRLTVTMSRELGWFRGRGRSASR